jgi:hypothetical protein
MPNLKQNILKLALAVMLVFFVVYWIFQSRVQKEKDLIYILESYASFMDGKCPIDIGDKNEVIIQKVYFIGKRTIVYEYHLLPYSKNSLNIKALKENYSEIVIDELESLDSLMKVRDNDVIFEYRFFDNKDEELFEISAFFNTPIKIID